MASLKPTGKTTPDINTVVNIVTDTVSSILNCHNIGKIIDFDPNDNTVTVELLQQKQFYDQTHCPPPLEKVPLIVLGGGLGHLTFPSPVGSYCLILFNDRDIDNWFESGESNTPNTPRKHDFSDAIALVGLHSKQNLLKDYDATITGTKQVAIQ